MELVIKGLHKSDMVKQITHNKKHKHRVLLSTYTTFFKLESVKSSFQLLSNAFGKAYYCEAPVQCSHQ
jgi:hypothetical protein